MALQAGPLLGKPRRPVSGLAEEDDEANVALRAPTRAGVTDVFRGEGSEVRLSGQHGLCPHLRWTL